MQLGHRYVHVGVVIGVQGDSAYADAVGEDQVRLGGVVAWPAVSLEQDAGGTGAGRTVGTRQAQVGAAPVPPAALIKAWGGRRQKDWCKETKVHFTDNFATQKSVGTCSWFLFTQVSYSFLEKYIQKYIICQSPSVLNITQSTAALFRQTKTINKRKIDLKP